VRITVIIPVYNTAKFITEAVVSALLQPETGEVILVEDGSTDDSLEICRNLDRQYDKVRLLQHPGGKNRGISHSRNLGLEHAAFDWIAFLDADDYMLSDRFKTAAQLVELDSTIDGVYDAVGTQLEGDKAKDWWALHRKDTRLTTLGESVPPEDLLTALCAGDNGFFHTNGIVFKRELLKQTGMFDVDLRVAEDTLMWRKLAATGKLVGGSLEAPVAIRRVHGENTIIQHMDRYNDDNQRMRIKALRWAIEKRLGSRDVALLRSDVVNSMPCAKPLEGGEWRFRISQLYWLFGLLLVDVKFLNNASWRWAFDNMTGWSRVKRRILQLLP
jgi:glycosyltransferase involved in cell wall biosynthesis